MDKLTLRAFEKLEKKEHFLRREREQRALGRITKEVFREREAEILAKYELTDEEQRAYERHSKMRKQR